MEVDIKLSIVELDKELEALIQRKLEYAFSRTAHYISSISITLSKRGKDAKHNDVHCLLKISIIDSQDIVIEDTQSDLYYVIDRAIQKAQRMMERIVSQ